MQQIEIRYDELSNAITPVNKDSLVVEIEKQTYIEKKYAEFYEKYGYIPEYFDIYNGREIKNIAPTLTTGSNGAMGAGTVLIISKDDK